MAWCQFGAKEYAAIIMIFDGRNQVGACYLFRCRSPIPGISIYMRHPNLMHWFRRWFGVDQATSYYLNHWWLGYRRIYASLGLNEFREAEREEFSQNRTKHSWPLWKCRREQYRFIPDNIRHVAKDSNVIDYSFDWSVRVYSCCSWGNFSPHTQNHVQDAAYSDQLTFA